MARLNMVALLRWATGVIALSSATSTVAECAVRSRQRWRRTAPTMSREIPCRMAVAAEWRSTWAPVDGAFMPARCRARRTRPRGAAGRQRTKRCMHAQKDRRVVNPRPTVLERVPHGIANLLRKWQPALTATLPITRSRPCAQSMSVKRRARTSPARQPNLASSRMIARSREPAAQFGSQVPRSRSIAAASI